MGRHRDDDVLQPERAAVGDEQPMVGAEGKDGKGAGGEVAPVARRAVGWAEVGLEGGGVEVHVSGGGAVFCDGVGGAVEEGVCWVLTWESIIAPSVLSTASWVPTIYVCITRYSLVLGLLPSNRMHAFLEPVE